MTHVEDEGRPEYKPDEQNPIEDVVLHVTNGTIAKVLSEQVIFNSGADGSYYILASPVRVTFQKPRPVQVEQGHAAMVGFTFGVGIKIAQSRMTVDRKDGFVYALVVENCVTSAKYTASRRPASQTSTIEPVNPRRLVSNFGDVFHGLFHTRCERIRGPRMPRVATFSKFSPRKLRSTPAT